MKHWHVTYRTESYNCKHSFNGTKPEPYTGCKYRWPHGEKISLCEYETCPLEKTKMYFDKKYEIPIEEISCPGCGDRYGRYNKKVCSNCEECSKCCRCETKELVSATAFIENHIGYPPMEKTK